MNLTQVQSWLSQSAPDAKLIFVTDDGPVGAGYHVTELKQAQVTGIDCAGRTARWNESAVQLLDGHGESHMPVGKFSGILGKSLNAVAGLGEGDLKIEFAHGNAGLRLFEVDDVQAEAGDVLIRLRGASAMCKPAQSLRSEAKARCCR